MRGWTLALALCFALVGLAHGAKHKFNEGDKVTLWANKGASDAEKA